MTAKGTPFWAAPELLSGKRFREHADTFSFGVVLYEIAVRHVPYEDLIKGKKKKGRGFVMELARKVGRGELRPKLEGEPACKKYAIGGAFRRRGLSWFCLVFFLSCLGLALSPSCLVSVLPCLLHSVRASKAKSAPTTAQSSASALLSNRKTARA